MVGLNGQLNLLRLVDDLDNLGVSNSCPLTIRYLCFTSLFSSGASFRALFRVFSSIDVPVVGPLSCYGIALKDGSVKRSG